MNSGGTGVSINAYRITFEQSDGLFTPIVSECDGTQASVVSSLQCEVQMTTFLGAPFNLVEGNLIVVMVEALNAIDYSVPSAPNTNGVLTQVPPHTPTSAPTRGSLTNENQIEVLVSTVSATGGSPLLSYSIEINDGSGFVSIGGDPVYQLSQDLLTTTPLTSGVTYNFRYRVANIFGWSGYSPEVLIIANTVPTQPLSVTTSNMMTQVVIAWQQSASTGGNMVPLTSYKFYAQPSQSSVFVLIDSSNCVEDMAVIIAINQCTLSMSIFTGSTFNLQQGDSIYAKVQT